MQILLVLGATFRLDRVVQGLEEWAWLPEYVSTLNALHSIIAPKKGSTSGTEGILLY